MDPPKQDQKISVTASQIAIYFDNLSVGGIASGNSPIYEYVLEEDDGSGWSVAMSSKATNFIKKNAIAKKEYKYKVGARNVYGLGPLSVPVILSTGQRPDAPGKITSINP